MTKLYRLTMWINAFTFGFCIPGIFVFDWYSKVILIGAAALSLGLLLLKIQKINGRNNNN